MGWRTLCGISCGYKGGVLRNKYKNIRMIGSDMPVCIKCRDSGITEATWKPSDG
jgi:hypothetical protein